MNDAQNDSSESDAQDRQSRRPFAGFGKPPVNLAELPDKFLALLRQSPAGEIEQNFKNLMNSTISKLDLVTREEFEIQQEMVEKLRRRVEKIEATLEQTSNKTG